MTAETAQEQPPAADDIAATHYLDSDHADIVAFAEDAVAGARDDAEKGRRLFGKVRDYIRYEPYGISLEPDDYRASIVLHSERNWCVPKAVLLTAAARAVGLPARIGFADVRNHLSSEKLISRMGTDLFVFHGYVMLYVNGQWYKVSPAFNAELCERFGVSPLDFDGSSDALLHAYDGEGRRHMEYVRDRGTYPDLPFDEIMSTFVETYGRPDATAGETHDRAFHD